jgi:hypothetical protein
METRQQASYAKTTFAVFNGHPRKKKGPGVPGAFFKQLATAITAV